MPLSAWLFALGAALLFGLALNLAQLGMKQMEAALGSVVSIPTAAALFWLSAPLTVDFSGWRTDAALLFAAVGIFYPAVVTILTFEGTRWIGPNLTAALGNLAPLYAIAAGVLLLGEALGPGQLAGVIVLMGGVITLTTSRVLAGSPVWPLWALGFPLVASLFRGLGQPLLKIGFEWWNNPRVATLLCYASSACVVGTVGLWRTRGTTARFTPSGIRWFMLVGLANGIATWAGIEAVSRGPVSLVSPVMATYPLFTLGLGRLMGRAQPIGWRQAGGIAATVLGVGLLLAGQ